MSTVSKIFVFLIVMMSFVPLSYSATFKTINGEVVIEAEDYTSTSGSVGPWVPVAGYYMQSPSGGSTTLSFKEDDCRMDYDIYFYETGIYYLHLRTHAVDHTQNGFFATLDGVQINYGGMHPDTHLPAEFIYVEKSNAWNWYTDGGGANSRGLAVSVYVGTPGYHTFSIHRREKGSKIDRFWLTKHESASQNTATLPLPNANNFIITGGPIPDPPAEPDTDPYPQSEARVWQPHNMAFTGPVCSQTGTSPNPFLDRRLNVTFTKGAKSYIVPGFFDSDANGGTSGNQWRVIFTPDEAGVWGYTVSFRAGSNIAVSNSAGSSAGFMDGQTGSITVAERDANAPGYLSKGRLVHVPDVYYLKTLGDNEYWIKGGTNSPENYLGCPDIANTTQRSDKPYLFHTWGYHARDWNAGDPIWDNGKGKGIIGSLNYLASKNVNSLLAILMNIGGDGMDVWPFAGNIDRKGNNYDGVNTNKWFDCKKLRQWELIFAHAQKKGLALQLMFNEAEIANKMELDGADLGTERKLFYREMIARFGHHNAIVWNISEEYNYASNTCFTLNEVKDFAQYIKDTDPYDHPVTIHNRPGDNYNASDWTELMGSDKFDLTSFQFNTGIENDGQSVSARVESLRDGVSTSGRVIPVSIDEMTFVATEDDDHMLIEDMGGWSACRMGQKYVRKNFIYPIYFSGGMTELILETVLRTLDFRTYSNLWDYMWNARKFVESNLPYWEMSPADHLVTGYFGHADVFAKEGEYYAIYLPAANDGAAMIDLSGVNGTFLQRWYNPRTGNFQGGEITIDGGANRSLGAPPESASDDWVVLISKIGSPPPPPQCVLTFNPTEDAYLQSSTRYNNDKLRADLNNNRVSYLKFDINGFGNKAILRATLKLRVKDDDGYGELSLYAGNGNSWTEADLNDFNAPDPLGIALETKNETYSLNTWYEFDVTDAVTGDGIVSFVLRKETVGGDVAFGSKESTGYAPELVVECDPSSDNLLENASFENGLSSWTRKGAPVTISQATSPVRSGTGALSISGRQEWWHGANQNIYSDLQANGKGGYKISLWIKPTVADAGFNGEITLKVNGVWYQGAAISGEIKTLDWQLISGIVDIDWNGTLEDALFSINTTGDLQDFYVDDCEFVKAGTIVESSIELLANPGFENGISDWWAKGIRADVSTVNFPVYTGSEALLVTGREVWWHGFYQNIFNGLNTNGPGLYKVSAWIKRAAVEDTCYLVGVSTKVNGVWSQPVAISAEIKNDDWVKVEGYIDLAWGGTLEEAQFNINTTGNLNDFYVDDCSFVKVENLN